MARPQVNVALSVDEYDMLVALAFVEEMSASELLRPVVSSFLNEQTAAPEVAKALEALHARRARRAGKVTELRDRARKDIAVR